MYCQIKKPFQTVLKGTPEAVEAEVTPEAVEAEVTPEVAEAEVTQVEE